MNPAPFGQLKVKRYGSEMGSLCYRKGTRNWLWYTSRVLRWVDENEGGAGCEGSRLW